MGKTYVYYSYEEHGRGYIGARNRSPVNDTYFGTFSDKTFNPTEKVVIAEFETWEEALQAEVELHAYFEVDINPHFANKARQTSSGFYYDATGREVTEEEREKNRKSWTPERRQAQAERLRNYNKSEHHKEVVVRRNKEHKSWGNKSRTGMTNSKESNEKRSKTLGGAPKPKTQRERLKETTTGRKAITDGTTRTWLYPGQPMPTGWWYAAKNRG